MASDTSELIFLCGGAALINVTYAAQHKHSIPGSLVASGVSFAGLTFLAGVWRTDVAVALAALFFFAALIIRGLPLINSVSELPAADKKTSFGSAGGGTF